MVGRVIKKEANSFLVDIGAENIICTSQKKLKTNGVYVGDRVEVDEKAKQILKTLPRTNKLLRPPLVNLDKLFILITSVPQPDYYLLDKLILFCKVNSIQPIICHSKTDLGESGVKYLEKAYGKHFVVKSFSSLKSRGISEIKDQLKNSVSAVAGQSGVGKSALLNALLGENIAVVGDLSKKIERGVNTTRHSRLYEIFENSYLADTAGFSSLDETFLPLKAEELAYYYPEFIENVSNCRFSSCTHTVEPNCAVKAAVEQNKIDLGRYERYLMIFENLKQKKY